MRYSLRNQEKIQKTFGVEFLNVILASLFMHFHECKDTELKEDGKYKILTVINQKEPTKVIEFYVLSITYDVYNLAYKP